MKTESVVRSESSSGSDDENEDISQFNSNCKHITEATICSENKYILHMSGSRESNPNVLLGLSDNTSEVYKFADNRLAKLDTFTVNNQIIDVKVHPNNNNLFYLGAKSCEVTLWDLRTPNKAVNIFKDTSLNVKNAFRPMTCFDVSPNNRLLAAGTEVFDGDSFILFWDVRNTKTLGGYWESHMDDITQIKFHYDDVNRMISSSTDGLINVYDLLQSSEDDALVDSLNTESSVERLLWYSQGHSDFICCLFHTHDLQLWKSDGVQPCAYFSREVLTEHIKRKSCKSTYIGNAHTTASNRLFLLVGSTHGRLCSFKVKKSRLEPMWNLEGNRQIVRSSWYGNEASIFVTGGEKGLVNVWEVDRCI